MTKEVWLVIHNSYVVAQADTKKEAKQKALSWLSKEKNFERMIWVAAENTGYKKEDIPYFIQDLINNNNFINPEWYLYFNIKFEKCEEF